MTIKIKKKRILLDIKLEKIKIEGCDNMKEVKIANPFILKLKKCFLLLVK